MCPDDLDRIRQHATPITDESDIDEVVALTVNELHQLHDGNIARYRLRLSLFRVWLEQQ